MSESDHVRQQLETALSQAEMRVIGLESLRNDAEARLLLAAIRAFGDHSAAFAHVSPTRAQANTSIPDLLLYHPDVGLITFESKAHRIDELEGIDTGNLWVRYQNGNAVDVIDQANRQLFEITNDIGLLLRNPWETPLTNYCISLANVTAADWHARQYEQTFPSQQLLFSEDLAEPECFRAKLIALAQQTAQAKGKSTALTDDQLIAVSRVFGNSNVINQPPGFRVWVEEGTLGSYIDRQTNDRNYLSEEQKELAHLQIDGTPRLIRGVAGSGKSVVLAELAIRHLCRHARLLDKLDPNASLRIGVICFNRALVPFLESKLKAALETQLGTPTLPDHLLCVAHLNNFMFRIHERSGQLVGAPFQSIRYIKITEISDPTDRAIAYRRNITRFKKQWPAHFNQLCFDVLFVDESQDLAPEEFRLLLEFVKPHPKTGEKPLVLFYDDAQNLYGHTRPNWEEIGLNLVGGRSRVMRDCFRNSRQIVELAFNVLLGTQAPEQIRVHTRTYADVAYLEEKGLVQEIDGHYCVRFAQREEQPPHVRLFDFESEEREWIAQEVSDLIALEQVRPEDILILTDSPGHAHFDELALRIGALVRQKLGSQTGRADLHFLHAYNWNQQDGGGHNGAVPYIFQPDQLTLSTIYSAKGYDAPVVFLTCVDHFPYSKEGRAAFYVGATRAMHRLYVTGVRTSTRTLIKEAEQVLQHV